jgi:microcin C transport system substrate-binding protein
MPCLLSCRLLLVGIVLFGAATAQAAPALSMLGTPKYATPFDHFDYVNPAAPAGGTFRMGTVGTFDSLNPFIIRGKAPLGLETGVFSLVYQSLMARGWDEPFTLYGLIADDVETPPDRSWVVFTLSPKARWQDGAALTADDVVFSFETLRDQGRPNHRTYYKRVKSAEKLGDRKVRFDFKPNPDGSWDRELPLIMALMPVLPQHIWASRPFNETTLTLPVGSGPYKVESVDPGRGIIYRKDPSYWAADLPSQKGLYHFSLIRVDYFRDESVALQAFKSGAFDVRREADLNRWALGYESVGLRSGQMRQTLFPHQRPEPMRGFALNLRRPLFQDEALREAVALAFDDGWMRTALFRGIPQRTMSFFAHSELATDPNHPPKGTERSALEKAGAKGALLTDSVAPPTTENAPDAFRAHLLQAAALLRAKGYRLDSNQLRTPEGALVRFEILLGDPADEKIALAWTRGLKRLGIQAQVRTVDSAQYQARLTSFDYDVTTARWVNSLSPGNEQIAYWSSVAATQKGSRNYPGLQDPVIDRLALAIPRAATRAELVATTRALDRTLLAQRAVIPFFQMGADSLAYWATRVVPPAVTPLYGTVLEAWWSAQPDVP